MWKKREVRERLGILRVCMSVCSFMLWEWSLRISKGLMQEGKRIEEFGLSSDLGDREAVCWHRLRTNDH